MLPLIQYSWCPQGSGAHCPQERGLNLCLLGTQYAAGQTPTQAIRECRYYGEADRGWAWCCTLESPARRMLRQEDQELETSPGYAVNKLQNQTKHRREGKASWWGEEACPSPGKGDGLGEPGARASVRMRGGHLRHHHLHSVLSLLAGEGSTDGGSRAAGLPGSPHCCVLS